MDFAGSYFEHLKSFKTAKLYITDRTDQIREETYHNCLHFDLQPNQSLELNEDDFVHFLSRIKADRLKQWINAAVNSGMIYYSWFDEMAGQLRINFINSNYAKLPFQCSVELVDDEREIITSFLENKSHGMIPWADLKDDAADELTEVANYTLKVYQQTLHFARQDFRQSE